MPLICPWILFCTAQIQQAKQDTLYMASGTADTAPITKQRMPRTFDVVQVMASKLTCKDLSASLGLSSGANTLHVSRHVRQNKAYTACLRNFFFSACALRQRGR